MEFLEKQDGPGQGCPSHLQINEAGMTPDTDTTTGHRFMHSGYSLLLLACLTVMIPAPANSQPFTPAVDSHIVEELPSPVIALSRQLRAERSARTESTTSGELLEQALESYRIATADQSPRAYGRTLSLLQRWPEDREKPVRYYVLLASVLQHNHEFDRALQHLDTALAREPYNAQAILIRAQIGLVTGDYAMARDSCRALDSLVRETIRLNCRAQLDGVTGSASSALQNIESRLTEGPPPVRQDLIELQLTAAVIAHRLGEDNRAEMYYLRVLQQMPTNHYALSRYANLLLETGQPGRLARLLSGYDESALNTELRILLAAALRTRDSDEAQARSSRLVDSLQEEFRVALLRDEGLSHKEYARLSLTLLDQPEQALEAARENWTLQKEPSDTLLLARTAAAAGDRETLQAVRQWVTESGLEYPRLARVLNRDEEAPQ
jgi:tetratricopeptide (TPR) repeat protein